MSFDDLYQAVKELPPGERLRLASLILEENSADDEGLSIDSPEFAEEIRSRLSDREGAMPWSQLRDEV